MLAETIRRLCKIPPRENTSVTFHLHGSGCVLARNHHAELNSLGAVEKWVRQQITEQGFKELKVQIHRNKPGIYVGKLITEERAL